MFVAALIALSLLSPSFSHLSLSLSLLHLLFLAVFGDVLLSMSLYLSKKIVCSVTSVALHVQSILHYGG